MRVKPSLKFAIGFAARARRQSVADLVLDAVMPIVESTEFRGKKWHEFDDPTPGYSECKLYLVGVPMNKDEDEIKRFVLTHREFFYDGDEPSRRRLDVLWSKVPHYAHSYFRRMKTDNLSTGHEMNAALVEAKRDPIPWPPEGER